MKTIMCYGDSNTWGFKPGGGRYDKKDRWTSILQELLGEEFDVINQGLNGRTTAYCRKDGLYKNGLKYLPMCIDTCKPIDYIVFVLGTNDCISTLNLSVEKICDGMSKLVDKARSYCKASQEYIPEIIIVAPARIGDNYANSVFAEQLNKDSVEKSIKLASLYKKLAEEKKCLFFDGSEVLEVSDVDSEHLTKKSHKLLAKNIAKIIKENS